MLCLVAVMAMGQPSVPTVEWDRHSLIIGGKRVAPVMGEIHYSRLPESEWLPELQKMKEGGVTMVANYVFWNHVEEVEGVFDWSGQRNLRRFLECCQQVGLPVVLRIGPFCHGEARCGGMPDWLVNRGVKLRSEDPVFLSYVTSLYRQIFTQVQGLQWKDGGPVLACQFDNEYRGRGSYLISLKRIANQVGFDLPLYTRTGWPELATPVPFGEMLPLYGDYADGFWDRSLSEGAGNYWQAFHFKAFRSSTAIATEQIDYSSQSGQEKGAYPYFTCELGGGMVTAYHRRPYLYPEDAYSLALVKLGSGSNLLGYYMYHGGTNPDGKLTYLNEVQQSPVTNYNDMPVKTYDFQAPLGEFGQRNPHYYMLRKLHLFMHDFAEELAPMEAVFPQGGREIKKGDDAYLRWCYRSKGQSGFIFVNNYERLQSLTAKKDVQLEACGVKLPRLTIPAGAMCIFPVNVAGIRYATAQLVARRQGNLYLEQIPGIPTDIAVDGKVLRHVKPRGTAKPVYKNIYLLTGDEAGRLFLEENGHADVQPAQVTFRKVKEAGPLRTIEMGVNKVAMAPADADFLQAAVYTIDVPAERQGQLLNIQYRGDCARLYADGRLIDDNFYNGRPFQYGLWRLPAGVKTLELRILPLQTHEPVYFPREADTTPGEEVLAVSVLPVP